MILQYKKVHVVFDDRHSTTITLREPDYAEDSPQATELCTIGDVTYVHVPDAVTLPEQPAEIVPTLEQVTMTPELKAEIKALCPHIKLSYKRLQDRIRSKYSAEDEVYFSRIAVGALMGTYVMQDDEPGILQKYQEWVEESREIARLERVSLGLG